MDWDAAGHTVTIEDNRGDLYLKGRKQGNGSSDGIMSNLIKASELKNILNDDGDNNLADTVMATMDNGCSGNPRILRS
ncbi:MAG: hypothetical protein VR69_02855 [Peptococcaceae bacterium BRH_c4b]|nr:MAG: hypothetical protein VR69_02855 [Peptococcaceae bacterium BRH_c4b]